MKKLLTIIISIFIAINSYGQALASEYEYKEYFKKNISTLDPIEGIWSENRYFKIYRNGEFFTSGSNIDNDQVAIKGNSFNTGGYNAWSLTSSDPNSIIQQFKKTATQGVYIWDIYYTKKDAYVKANAIISNAGIIEYSYEVPYELAKNIGSKGDNAIFTSTEEIKMIKIFPTIEDIKKYSPSSGSGFAINSNGVIVTNHHVISDANSINVRGINGDFSKVYKAKVLVDDKNNDLAIIKIDDNSFTSIRAIPYVISNKSNDVGCSIYCLGYPLRATMGDEVKLTNGIISSKSGFQGDVTTYQITAPIQPGNSGGPLFDDKGNLIGIVNAKHLGAENVSYAIKTPYLINLLNTLATPLKLQTVSVLSGKSLSEQVKIIRNFTYIIETN